MREQPNELATRNSINELCAAWDQSAAEIEQAFALLTAAQDRINTFFDGRRGIDIQTHRNSYLDFRDAAGAIKRMQRGVWGALIERLELRKILSLKRIEEMDRQIETGEGLPPISFDNIMAMLETNARQIETFMAEKVQEVYEFLRPRASRYVTNQRSNAVGLGKKVICTWYAVKNRYDGGFEVNYNGQNNFRAVDQVFHSLDGAAQSADHYGELVTAIKLQTSKIQNTFETPYFRGRCFKNGNLHLEFRRDDLLRMFNLIAGGKRLTEGAA